MSDTTLHVAIGNSDDRLTQAEWAKYVAEVDDLIRDHAEVVYGEWFSAPDRHWQSAAWTFALRNPDGPSRNQWLLDGLTRIRTEYRQDSVAVIEGVTRFV